MKLEFHQLNRGYEHLRVRRSDEQRRLMASLATSGQQTPIVVVAVSGTPDGYLVIDGYKRIAALEQLGRDTVEAVIWPMSECDALVLERSMRFGHRDTALEEGWLLAEVRDRFGYSLDDLSRRFDRSTSWVSRRLALVELLPQMIQQTVRMGEISAHVAMKYLVPVARVDAEHCERMAAVFIEHRCDTRQAGQLYTAWRKGTRVTRERILAEPELFLKTQRQAPAAKPAAMEQVTRDLEMAIAILHRANRRLTDAMGEMNSSQQEQTERRIESARRELARMAERIGKGEEGKHAEPGAENRDSGTEREGSEPARDCARIKHVAPDGAQSSARELQQRAGDPAGGESRAIPPTDPGSIGFVQGESRASP